MPSPVAKNLKYKKKAGRPKKKRRLLATTLVAAIAGLVAAWLVAGPMPRYLLLAEAPVQADAVVLLGGSDFKAREKMAGELMAQEWAKFLILPGPGEVFEARVSKALVTPDKTAEIARAVRADLAAVHVEETHIEIAQARALMQHIGATRAMFVSSPYHMRRIALIADRVFDEEHYTFAFVPTPYDPIHNPWFTHREDAKWVASEYLKILWFFVYAPFVG